MLAVGERTV